MASEIKVNNIKRATGTTITLGESGDTVALACGASQTGFGSDCMSWCAAIKSTGFTAVAGKGYFVNTCAGGVTVTLPATATQGDTIEFKDYKRTWGSNQLTINSNSLKYQGSASATIAYATDGQALKVVYADVTRGWTPTVDDDAANVHTYNVQYLNIAGGGGGGVSYGAGGGGGGLRTVACKSFSVTKGTTYPVTIGGGGAAPCSGTAPGVGVSGANSVFSTITSAGGGGGGYSTTAGIAGGSGGGGGGSPSPPGAAGAGNTPPTPCTQGSDGGAGTAGGGGGGGGHSEVGQASPGGGRGGAGSPYSISSTALSYSGGAGAYPGGGASPCGTGGAVSGLGTVNRGGGGGAQAPGGTAKAGGSGIVIIRRLTADSTSTSGSTAPTTCGADTIHTFTGDGTFVA